MGIFHAFEDFLLESLIRLQDLTGFTWAWTIILLTVIVRMAILPITVKQTRSMLMMQKLSPYLKQLQQKYKHDRQELQLKTMEFYRDNQVNPLASCLPVLVQIPIFLALFFVLRNFSDDHEEYSQASFEFLFGLVDRIYLDIDTVGWIGWALIAFYVASQMFASAVMITTPDPRQKYLMMFLPLAFVPFIVNFPVGLLLYWITTNLFTLVHYVVVKGLTDTSREIVLPEDNKGRKKVITPKGEKGSKSQAGAGEGAAGSNGSKSSNAGAAGKQPHARRNKRRR